MPRVKRGTKRRAKRKKIRARQRIFPNEVEAEPLRKRSGRARAEICLLGPQAAQAAVPSAVGSSASAPLPRGTTSSFMG